MTALKKILLVDDSKAFNFLSRTLLKENHVDCEVDEVLNGKAALEYLTTCDECPDVILLDINMPVMDGLEFLKRYENQFRHCLHTRIFVLTSSVMQDDQTASFSSKYVKGYFDKPLGDKHIQEILSSFE